MIDIQVEFSFDVNQILMNGRVVIFRGIGLDIAHANEQLYSPNRNRCGPQDYVQVEKAASLCALGTKTAEALDYYHEQQDKPCIVRP